MRPDHLVVDSAETNREDARIMGRYRGPNPAPGGDHAARSRAVRDALRDGYDEDALVVAIAGDRLFSWREAPIVPPLLPT